MDAPAGTVALVFTDIEASTPLAQALGDAWGDVLLAHHEIVGGAIEAHGGYIDSREGDGFFAVFADAREAVAAAQQAQIELRRRPWPPEVGDWLKVRMGIHAGHVERRAGAYVGLEIHRAARVAAAANGGQVLMTAAVRALVGDGVAARDLGRHRLKDFPSPESLHALVLDGDSASLSPPRTLVVRPTNLPADDRLLVGRTA